MQSAVSSLPLCLGLVLLKFTMILTVSGQGWLDPLTTYVPSGRNTSLRCAFIVMPSSSNASQPMNASNAITWSDTGIPIFSETIRLTQEAKYDNFRTSVQANEEFVESILHITLAGQEDEGMFTCIHGDDSGNVTSQMANLYVEDPPSSTTQCNDHLYRNLSIAFGVIICILVFLLALFIFIFQRRRERKPDSGRKQTNHISGNENLANEASSEMRMYGNVATTERELTGKQVGAKVPSRNIRFYSQIGSIGVTPFGQVWKGEIRGVPGKEKKKIEAAIRDLSGVVGIKNNLLDIVNTLWALPGHINVVKCLGCCLEQSFIVYEYIPYGTLLTYLQTNAGKTRSTYKAYVNVRSIVRRVKEPELLTFAWQIAKGMEFLASQKVVHGNLRASNVLLSENKICKIADYGLTRISSPKKTIHRWLSPEAILTGRCTTDSDVWSYGVLLWELVTLGAQPYPGVNDDELEDRISKGYKMRRPRHCGEDLFKIISNCWKTDTNQRNSFLDMQTKIGWMLEGSNDYLSLNRMSDEDIYTDIIEPE
ncbi:tyrosine kinase receptor Cad96Ca-like isoform X1 [Lytechinus variegatus]|uniref:tyrosine kinase receptor Cad96Ca-like isoform X1 n=1 Tax=Lytechinus variegatus TaxID=7654 RepID=UPI001BB14283|nr:tyrosine kinase receptor Cad96Ca-like isoform X1 [Lytechinus variegatus]XP_041470456.1 tyrosine kinase receptor Cad96Ca-like isoform X1 [Lytechinus variegatus]